MTVTYELWDMETGNFLEKFTSEAELLRAVHEYAKVEGDSYLDELGVRRVRHVHGEQEWLPTIDGKELRDKLAAHSGRYVEVSMQTCMFEEQRLVTRVTEDLRLVRGIHPGLKYETVESRGSGVDRYDLLIA
jgi:hypothetical protein